MNNPNGFTGLSVLNLENPEVVKLKIAKDNLDTLFSLKRSHIANVHSSFNNLIESVKLAEAALSHESCKESSTECINVDSAYRVLFTYALKLGVLSDEARGAFEIFKAAQTINTNKIVDDELPAEFENISKKGGLVGAMAHKGISNWVSKLNQSRRAEILVLVIADVSLWEKQELIQLEVEFKKFIN
jgi:hypothetical protein